MLSIGQRMEQDKQYPKVLTPPGILLAPISVAITVAIGVASFINVFLLLWNGFVAVRFKCLLYGIFSSFNKLLFEFLPSVCGLYEF